MGTIIANIQLTQTVTTANGAAVQTVQDWIQANITAKLPGGVTAVVTYTVVP